MHGEFGKERELRQKKKQVVERGVWKREGIKTYCRSCQ